MITIRNAVPDDAELLTRLMDELGYPANPAELRSRLENIGRHEDYRTLLAIDESGQIAGMIGMSKNYSYEHNGSYIRILAMAVVKTSRRKGVGKILLFEAEKWAKEINSNRILLNSGNRPERQDAYLFYQKMGYQIRSSGFVKILER